MDYAAIIKERVTTPELFSFYGFERDRTKKVRCMFHNDDHPSMKVYDGAGGYYCFSCNAHGDVIDFVKEYFNISFREAISKINNDFRLGLPINEPLDNEKRIEIERATAQRCIEREAMKRKREELYKSYDESANEWLRLSRQKEEYAPSSTSEPLNDLFIEAMIGISLAEERMEDARTKIYLFEHSTTLLEGGSK